MEKPGLLLLALPEALGVGVLLRRTFLEGGKEELGLVGVGYGREGSESLHMGLLPRRAVDLVGVGTSREVSEGPVAQDPMEALMGKVPKVLVGSEGMWMCRADFLVSSRRETHSWGFATPQVSMRPWMPWMVTRP